jgi:hypothetical protein
MPPDTFEHNAILFLSNLKTGLLFKTSVSSISQCKLMKRTFSFYQATRALTVAGILVSSTTAQAQWSAVGSAGISPGGLSNWQHLVFDAGNTPYVAFNDEGLPAGQGTVMKYNGTSWVTLGSSGFTPGIAHHSSFALGTGNTAYFSFADGNNVSKAGVMKFDGTSWSNIGSSLSVGECQYSSVKVTSGGTVYVGFIDNGVSSGSVTVKTYTGGTGWATVGPNATVSGGNCTYASMALDVHDTVYVAYQDGANSGKVTVKKFDGNNWITIGSPFLSQANGSAYDICLAFDHNNVPYVAYWNPYPAGPKASVQKFDGSNWVNVGLPSFTTGITQFTTIAFDGSNTPYITFQDAMQGQKATVMKYNGSTWVNVGAAGFSAGVTAFNSIAIDGNGNPYVAYYDGGNSQKTTVMTYTVCNAATVPAVTASGTTICKGDTVVLTATGTLNNATNWYWYTGSCGGTLVDSGASIHVAPGDTTTYYVRGMGGCVVSGACTPITVNVISVPVPTITASGSVLTSSAATGNQWNKSHTAIPGATGNTYTAATSGWYTVTVTSNGCSSTSDSVFVTGTGISGLPANSMVSIFPAPFSQSVQVRIGDAVQDVDAWQLIMTDNTGRIVYRKNKLGYINIIDTKQLSAGIYFITISSPAGKQVFKTAKTD